MGKKILILLIKVVFAIALLVFLFMKVNIVELLSILKETKLFFIIIAVILNFSVSFINAFRWKILLKVTKIKISHLKLVSFILVGSFFNAFLPSSVGGDVVRAIDLSRHTKNRASAFSSVLIDRLGGLGSLLIINCISLFFVYKSIKNVNFVFLSELILFSIFLVIITFTNKKFSLKLLVLFKPFINLFPKLNLRLKLKKLYNSFIVYKKHKNLLVQIIFVSMLSRIVWIFEAYLIALALGIEINMFLFFLFVPLAELIRLIPISFNGVGIREGAFVLFFSPYMSVPHALLLGIIFYALLYVNSFVGGVIYFLRSFKIKSLL